MPFEPIPPYKPSPILATGHFLSLWQPGYGTEQASLWLSCHCLVSTSPFSLRRSGVSMRRFYPAKHACGTSKRCHGGLSPASSAAATCSPIDSFFPAVWSLKIRTVERVFSGGYVRENGID